ALKSSWAALSSAGAPAGWTAAGSHRSATSAASRLKEYLSVVCKARRGPGSQWDTTPRRPQGDRVSVLFPLTQNLAVDFCADVTHHDTAGGDTQDRRVHLTL